MFYGKLRGERNDGALTTQASSRTVFLSAYRRFPDEPRLTLTLHGFSGVAEFKIIIFN